MQLKDERVRGLIASRLDRVSFSHVGDVEPVGQGISELRIHYMVLDIVSTFANEAIRSSSCCVVVIRVRS